MTSVELVHGRLRLHLETLVQQSGPSLLLLHELGGRGHRSIDEASRWGEDLGSWPGSIHSLDFTGHGESEIPAGAGYGCEVLLADADIALGHIGPATVLGEGLGGYIALLLSGARPRHVRGAIIAPGDGLAGGGPRPRSIADPPPRGLSAATPDPRAVAFFRHDVRPPGYARMFIRQARHLSGLESPVSVCVEPSERPPWLREISSAPGSRTETVGSALARHRLHPQAEPDTDFTRKQNEGATE